MFVRAMVTIYLMRYLMRSNGIETVEQPPSFPPGGRRDGGLEVLEGCQLEFAAEDLSVEFHSFASGPLGRETGLGGDAVDAGLVGAQGQLRASSLVGCVRVVS